MNESCYNNLHKMNNKSVLPKSQGIFVQNVVLIE